MNAIKNPMCIMVVVLIGCLAGLAARSGAGQAWVRLADSRWVNTGGADTVSGTVVAGFDYMVSFNPTGGTPIAGAGISLSPAPGSELTWVESPDDASYLWVTPAGAVWQPIGETISGYQEIWASRTPAHTSFDVGMTVTRSVLDPVVTAADPNTTVRLDVTLDAPVAAGTNFVNVGLSAWVPDGLSYDVLSVTKPAQFTGGGAWFSADPNALIVGVTYQFEVDLRVIPDDAFASGSIYHKPSAMMLYGREGSIGSVEANSVVLTLSSGAQATFSASETTTFSGRQVHQQTEVIFEPVVAGVGPAEPNAIMLYRGRETFGGQPLHLFFLEVNGRNIAGVELTTPTSRTVSLEHEDGEEWVYEFEVTDPNALTDFGSGAYTLRFYSTDESNSVVTQVALADVPPPSGFPTTTSPAGDTTDHTPTIAWGAPADGNVNFVMVGLEHENWEDIETSVDPNVTSMTFGPSVPLGFTDAWVAFANSDSGQTAEGIDYQAAWFALTHNYFNIIPGIPGDVNGDGNLDNLDITPFIYALTNGEAAFEAQYPDGAYWAADCHGDGNIDNLDITPFISILSGGGDAVPGPAALSLLALGGLALFRRKTARLPSAGAGGAEVSLRTSSRERSRR